MEWLSKMSTANLIVLGIVSLIAIGIVAVALVFVVKNIQSVKFGKAEINGKTQKEIEAKEDRKLFIEIMNFSWKLNQQLADGESFYKKQARREIKERIYNYAALMKSTYRKNIMNKNPGDYKMTYAAFTETLDGQFYMKQMLVMMDCYEHNHISNASDETLRQKADEVYAQIASAFREYFQEPWLEEMCDYEDLRSACFEIEPKVKQMLFQCLKEIQKTLQQLYKMRTAIQNVKNAAFAWIIEKGSLPIQVDALVETFFEPVQGLNVDRVNECLDLMRL